MARRIITKEIKEQVYDEIQRLESDEISVDFVAGLLRKLLVYDPKLVEDQWYRDKARRLLAQRRDDCGIRVMFATQEPDRGVYINIEACKNLNKVRAVKNQLADKYAGIGASLAKASRRVMELEGQLSLFHNDEVRPSSEQDSA